MIEEPRSKSWWLTLPGVLTAIAGIITAVTGLMVTLHQMEVFQREEKQPPPAQYNTIRSKEAVTALSVTGASPGAATPSPGGSAAKYPINLSVANEVRIGDYVYKVLAAQLDRYGPNKLSLRFEVRLTSNGRYGANFWAASFRLLVDGVLRAPVNDLNELVDGHSSKEGMVEFVIPDTTTDVGLQIGEVGEGAPTIPIALKGAKP
jgi:hypothetical protein